MAKNKKVKAKKPPKAKKEKAAKPPKAKTPPRRPTSSGKKIQFTCSECYEEFNLSVGQLKDSITCPECLHVGKRPQEDFVVKISQTKGREKGLAGAAIFATILFVVAGLGLVISLSPYRDALPGFLTSTLLLMGVGVLTLVLVFLGVQYERNRWDVYF